MAKTAKKTKGALWKRIVASVKAGSKGGKPGQWSARKAQIATARYKKAGGGYKGKKSCHACERERDAASNIFWGWIIVILIVMWLLG